MLIIPILLGIKYYSILHAQKKPFRDILSPYQYIYTDVKHNDSIYTIVIEGEVLYGGLKYYMYNDNYSIIRYMFFIDYSLWHNIPIKINDTLNYYFEMSKVNKRLCRKYEDLNYIRKECMNPYGCIKYDLDTTDNVNTMIYILLKNNINCWRDCESGCTHVLWNSNQK